MGYLTLLAAAIPELHQRHAISPNVHVILVHFPLGMFIFGLFLEVAGLVLWRRSSLRLAARWMILFGALLAVPAALTGIEAFKDVMEHSKPALDEIQMALMKQHVLWTSIGAGLAAFTVTLAMGLCDKWRRLLYFPILILLAAAAGMLAQGSHFGGEGVYLKSVAVKLVETKAEKKAAEEETSKFARQFEYFAPAQSTHVALAGFGVAIALGALGTTLRTLSTHPRPKDVDAERELQELTGAPAPQEPVSVTVTVEGPAATRAPSDMAVSRSINPAVGLPMPRVPSGRFWLLSSLVFLAAMAFGVWLLISVEDSEFFTRNPTPTVDSIWKEVVDTARATNLDADKGIMQNRRGAHVLVGVAVVLFPLVLALCARLIPRRRWVVGTLCLVMVLLIAAEIWLGILLLHDDSAGPLYKFTAETASVVQALA